MKILDEIISATNFHTFIGTSFGIDLLWFETLILRQLKKKNVSKFLLFGDADELSDNLRSVSDKLLSSGNSYIIQPIKLSGRFHPKIFILFGETKIRLYIGSGNITRGGLGKNREVFEKWEISQDSGTISPVFFEIKKYFNQLLDNHLAYMPEIVQQMVQIAFNSDLFNKPKDESDQIEVWCSPTSMFSKLPTNLDPANFLRVVSPYFDEKGAFIIDLVKHFKIQKFDVITDIRKTNLTPEAIKKFEDAGGRIKKIDPTRHKRQLHAKMIHVLGESWAWGTVGSANASVAAWRGRNSECIVIRKNEGAEGILSLINELQVKTIDEDDRAKIAKMAENANKENPLPEFKGPEILYAEWVQLNTIQVLLKGEIKTNPFQIHLSGQEKVLVNSFDMEDLSEGITKISFSCSSSVLRGGVTIIYLSHDGLEGRHVVIHDKEELLSQSQKSDIEIERLEELLGADEFHPLDAEKLLSLYSSILRQRVEIRGKRNKDLKKNAPEKIGDTENPDFVTVDLENLQSSVDMAKQNNTNQIYSGALTNRMMKKLLFGDITTESDDRISESEWDEENSQTHHEHKRREKNDECTPKEKESFLKAAQKAREYYIENIKSLSEKNLYRCLDDLQILTAPLHYMLLGGGMSLWAFHSELVQILRAFLGNVSKPILSELRKLDEEARQELWERSPLLLLTFLLCYNACLTHNKVQMKSGKNDIRFLDCLPVLWLRHLIRTIPNIDNEKIEDILSINIPKLRWGIFWIADKFPALREKLTFKDYITTMLHDAQAINRVDLEFDNTFLNFLGKCDLIGKDDEQVLTRPTPGSLGVGWVEDDRGYRVLAQDGAFQEPEVSGRGESMRRFSLDQAVPISFLIEHAKSQNNPSLVKDLKVLQQIAP